MADVLGNRPALEVMASEEETNLQMKFGVAQMGMPLKPIKTIHYYLKQVLVLCNSHFSQISQNQTQSKQSI